MVILSSSKGITLVFKDEQDLVNVTNHLVGMLKAKNGNKDYPAVYLTYEESLSDETALEELALAKKLYK